MYNPKATRWIKRFSKEQQEALEYLRDIVLGTLKDTKEEVKWNVPFYYPICYLNVSKGEVRLSFLFGDLIQSLHFSPYNMGKHVRHLVFKNKNDIKKKTVVEVLKKAEQMYKTMQKAGINPLSHNR